MQGAVATFPDLLTCCGLYHVKQSLPFTRGVELRGEVAALGPDTTGLACTTGSSACQSCSQVDSRNWP
jgi:NADPH:quinone reductase-like Zn-dependent oxidoreductase